MGSLVQQHSTVGAASVSQVETFAAATAGNALIVVAATNENAGVDNINTPAGYSLLGTFRQGTTHANIAVFGKVAIGGETSVTVTSSIAQRLQTWFGEFTGFTLGLDGAISTAGSSSAGLVADTGTATPTAAGRLWLGIVAVKNMPASGLTGSGAGTAAAVNNEGGATSAQKLTLGVWYDVNRSASARQQPTWTVTNATFAGLGILLTPSVAPAADATIVVNRASVLRASTVTELHALHVQNSIRGRPTSGAPTGFTHNARALNNAIALCNALFDGHANHIGWSGSGSWQQMDPVPYGGYSVGAQVAGATLDVDNGAHFPTASTGLIARVHDVNTRASTTFTFTGKTGNQLTGCSGLPATIPAGSVVALYQFTNNGFASGADRPLLNDSALSYSVKELWDAMTATKHTLVLHGASTWTHGQASMNFPPAGGYIKAWAWTCAEICAAFAAAGSPITHVDVWNEYKGWTSQATPTTGQGGTGVLFSGATSVWQPGDAGAQAALNSNYLTAGYFLLHYQMMFNAVWDAIKNHPSSSVNTIKVMGPHDNLGPYANGNQNNRRFPFGSFNGTLQASGFMNGTNIPESPFDRDKICYFLDYATGFDAVALDYSVAGFNATPYDETFIHANLDSFRDIIKQTKSLLANRPGLSAAKRLADVNFIEFYADVDLGRVSFRETPTNNGLTDMQQGYFEAAILRRFLEEGLASAYKWQPMGDGDSVMYDGQAYFLHTQIADGGVSRQAEATTGDPSPATLPGDALPAYDTAKTMTDNFPVGTTLYTTTSDDGSGKIWAIANATSTVVGNGYAAPKNVLVEGVVRTVPAYSLLVVAAAGGLVAASMSSTGSGTSAFTGTIIVAPVGVGELVGTVPI